MPHAAKARRSNRVSVAHLLKLMLFASLSMIASVQLAGGVAYAQSADPVSLACPMPAAAQADRFPLAAGSTLVQGQKYYSESGNHYLIFQTNGNIVVYTAADAYVLGMDSAIRNYAQTRSVQMQSDGNLVVRGANDKIIWSALNKNLDPSAYLVLTPEGVIQIVSGKTCAVLWASDGKLYTATPAAVTPAAVTPDAVTPDAVTPDAVTPDAVTPEIAPPTITPDAVTPEIAPPTITPDAVTPETAPPTITPTITATVAPDPNALAFDPPMLEFVWQKGSRNPASQKVVVRNAGGGDKVGWHPSEWVNATSAGWVANDLQMNIVFSPASANLDVGVHESQLVLDAKGMTITLPVRLTVVSADGTLQVNRKQLNFGGFLGDPIADQSLRLTFTGLNSANWTASGPSWLKLTPANGSVSATAPTSLTVGIDTTAINEAKQYTGTLTLTDGKTTYEIPVGLFQVAPGSPTIQLFGLEVTQGLQNLLNDIPFVAGRPAFVRGHVRSLTGAPIEKVTAQLIGMRDGVELGRLNPINPGGSINIVADPSRAQVNESFLFELPESWRTGTVSLRLVGQSQPIACVDLAEKSAANSAADDCTVTLTYETVPALPITYFLYKDVGTVTLPNGRTTTANFEATAALASDATRGLKAGLPLPSVDQEIKSPLLAYPGQRQNPRDNGKVLDNINKLHQQAGNPLRHYYGLFARYPTTTDPNTRSEGGPGGVAAVPGFTGMGEFYTFQPYDLLNAHEIGHNLGRSHVNCGNPASPDPNFPHPNQQISDVLTGDAAYFGFNIFDKTIYPPTTKDLMTYCWPQWISPYTYKAMLEELKVHYNPPAGTSAGGQTGASPGSPILLVSGLISGTTAGSIDGVVDDNAAAALPAPAASDYSVRLEDASGQTIATYPVTPQTTDGQTEGQNQEELVTYTLAVPRPENLARVVLLYQDQQLAERVASANAPTLTLTNPVGGESLDNQPLSITWSADDADGDPLTFNVDYSTDDGASWRKLVWNWPDTTLEVDSALLPGSQQARIRVSANDGFLTTFAQSEAFTVADHLPVAIILSTDLNRTYVGGQTILLEGTGYDLEDVMVSDLTWYSDRDGVLGTGPTLALNADDLVEGTHLIRLEAKDSTGQSSFGDPTMGFTSEEGSVAVKDTVSFDVFYDLLTLPAELAVVPELGFFVTPGATEPLTAALTVSNLGDGDLEWTASSDAANVTLSSDSGSAPAIVVVTVDPNGLAGGLHEGTLTFTPTDAALAPVTVHYFINVYAQSPVESSQENAYVVENQRGGADAAWNEVGVWVIGSRQNQHVVALDITSTDDGQTLAGTVTYAGEGPIRFRGTQTGQSTYLVEYQWGAADAAWNPGGTWVLGKGEDKGIVALSISSDDGGSTLKGTVTYAGEDPIGFRATLGTASASDESGATDENSSDQAGAESETVSDAAEPAAEAAAEATPEPTEEASTQPTAPLPGDRFPLLPGQAVERERKIFSESGNHYLIFQKNGNVTVRRAADDSYVWGSEKVTNRFRETQSVLMQPDGNFAVYGANNAYIWSALTQNPDPSAYLTLTPEGVLRLISGDTGATLWASDGDLSAGN